MGNEQQHHTRPIGKASKIQIQVAALKARIHLEMMRDRKQKDIIKAEKQLVAKIQNKGRNRTEEILVAQRTINGLKYVAACNQLIADSTALKNQAAFISENLRNSQRLQPWQGPIYNLLYGAERLGITSLTEVKTVMSALNDPQVIISKVNPDFAAMLTPSPTPEQLNIYIVEMSERNKIPLEQINMVGHHFTKDLKKVPSIGGSELFGQISKKLGDSFQKSFQKPNPNNNQGFNPNNNQGFNPNNNPGFNPYHNPGYNPNNNPGYNPNNNQGFNPNNNSQQNPYIYPNSSNDKPGYLKKEDINPYKGFSNINEGPDFYQPTNLQKKEKNPLEKPKQFIGYQNFEVPEQKKQQEPIYPSVEFSKIKLDPYKPSHYQGHPPSDPNPANSKPSPTLSQLMRQFD